MKLFRNQPSTIAVTLVPRVRLVTTEVTENPWLIVSTDTVNSKLLVVRTYLMDVTLPWRS